MWRDAGATAPGCRRRTRASIASTFHPTALMMRCGPSAGSETGREVERQTDENRGGYRHTRTQTRAHSLIIYSLNVHCSCERNFSWQWRTQRAMTALIERQENEFPPPPKQKRLFVLFSTHTQTHTHTHTHTYTHSLSSSTEIERITDKEKASVLCQVSIRNENRKPAVGEASDQASLAFAAFVCTTALAQVSEDIKQVIIEICCHHIHRHLL